MKASQPCEPFTQSCQGGEIAKTFSRVAGKSAARTKIFTGFYGVPRWYSNSHRVKRIPGVLQGLASRLKYTCLRKATDSTYRIYTAVPVPGPTSHKTLRKSTCVCCVFSSHSFWTSGSLDVPAGVTQDFSSTFLLRCVPSFFSREGFSRSFPSSTVKSNFLCTNDKIVLRSLGIFFFFLVRKIPFTGIELTSQCFRRLRGYL